MTHHDSIIPIHPSEIMTYQQKIKELPHQQCCNHAMQMDTLQSQKPAKKKTNPIKQSNICQQGTEFLMRNFARYSYFQEPQ